MRVFRRDNTTGGLIPIQSGIEPGSWTYTGPLGLALSPDESLLAVTYDKACTLAIFNRSRTDGKLTLQKAWCEQEDELKRRMLSTVEVAFSHDGMNIYVVARQSPCALYTLRAKLGNWTLVSKVCTDEIAELQESVKVVS